MKKTITLTLIALIASIIIAYVNSLVEKPIEANRATHAIKRLEGLLPTNDPEELCRMGIQLIEVTTKGYGGDMTVTVASKEGSIIGVRVPSHQETPGFSDVLDPGNWIDLFAKKHPDNVDAVARVTITSAAVLRSMRDIAKQLAENEFSC